MHQARVGQGSPRLQNCIDSYFDEVLEVKIEPDNVVDKYAVYVKKDGEVVGYLIFAKIIFYFLWGDPFSESTAKIKEDLHVPCSLQLVGQNKFVEE